MDLKMSLQNNNNDNDNDDSESNLHGDVATITPLQDADGEPGHGFNADHLP